MLDCTMYLLFILCLVALIIGVVLGVLSVILFIFDILRKMKSEFKFYKVIENLMILFFVIAFLSVQIYCLIEYIK